MLNDIDKCTAMLFDSEGEYPFALPPVSLVPGTFVLLILFMLPPAKKFVFFCNRGVIPIRFARAQDTHAERACSEYAFSIAET